MTVETQSRVQLAAAHWKPRFVANGIDVNDFERVLAAATDWRDWAPRWQRVGDEHLSLAESAERKGRLVSATEAYQRAAWCYHLGKFLWFEDRALHDLLRERSVATYAKALAGLDPPGLRIEAPFEGASIPGILRIPERAARSGKLRADAVAGAVVTVSNLGTLGVDRFTAIVNPPEAAIIAVGRVSDRVVAKGGSPAVRPVVTLTLSVDHRVADGATAARYLSAVADRLERGDL
ncbi:MAG: 2-oxo acid dehydrogenase subunit E2 [Chloroflexi bacterium]|nr:MAG: 2-oxo acid dehydrogenase subunit E2 [Chloroflexota bacterium]